MNKEVNFLVVDDNLVNLAFLEEMLRLCVPFCKVAQTTSPSMAVEMFRQKAFDAVLTDLIMPVYDGWWLIRELRAFDPKIPIMLVTASEEKDQRAQAQKEGVLFLQKPVLFEYFKPALTELLAKANGQEKDRYHTTLSWVRVMMVFSFS